MNNTITRRLTALSLAIVFAGCAWADYAKTWTCDFGDNYETQVAKYVTNASVANSIIGTSASVGSETTIFSQETGTAGAKNNESYLKIGKTGDYGTYASVVFPFQSMGAEAYSLTFDYMPSRSYTYDNSKDNNGMCLVDAKGNILFTTFHTSGDVTIYKGINTENVVGTIAASDTIQYRDSSESKGKWFRFSVTGDENGIFLTVTKLEDSSLVVENYQLSSSVVAPSAVVVKTGNHGGRFNMACLDDFNFQYNEAADMGVTTLASGTITESIKFGAEVETTEAITLTSVGSPVVPIYFFTANDSIVYGLSQTDARHWVIDNSYLTIYNGAYGIKNNLQVGNTTSIYLTIDDGELNLDGAILVYSGSVDVNGGTITQAGDMYIGGGNKLSTSTFNLNGGNVSASRVRMGQDGRYSYLYLNGGSLTTGDFYYDPGNNNTRGVVIGFNGGKLVASANSESFIPPTNETTGSKVTVTVNVDEGGGTIDTAGHSITIPATITGGTGMLKKAGIGSLTLSAVPQHRGGTRIEGGSLVVSASEAFDVTTVTIAVSDPAAAFEAGTALLTVKNPADPAAEPLIDSSYAENYIVECGTEGEGDSLVYTYKLNVPKEFAVKISDSDASSTNIKSGGLNRWLARQSIDLDDADVTQTALETPNTHDIRGLDAYLLGYENIADAAPALCASASGGEISFGFAGTTPRSIEGISVAYEIQSRDSITGEWESNSDGVSTGAGVSLAIDKAGLYNRLVATITATPSVPSE